MHIRFYSKPHCGLCDEGYAILKLVQEDVGFSVETINIEEDDVAHEKYMFMIPVVELNGQVVQYGLLDYPTLLEVLL